MDILSALILGLVQGLTEFLPVSSSGHLVLFQHLLGFTEPNLAFDLLMHVGTLVAVVIYFWRDIFQITGDIIKPSADNSGRKWAAFIIVATLPTVIIGFSFKDQFESIFGEPHIVAVMLWVTAILLLVSDRIKIVETQKSKLNLWRSLLVGTVQGLAIIPGISRSGSTITAGIFTGINPTEAARFSFLLSIPAILGATLLESEAILGIKSADIIPYALGTLTSFISGYLAIAILLKLVVKRKLWRFSVYLFVVGLAGLILN